jgi:hypothetical protein
MARSFVCLFVCLFGRFFGRLFVRRRYVTARLRLSATRHVAPAMLQRGMLHAAWSVSRNRMLRCAPRAAALYRL